MKSLEVLRYSSVILLLSLLLVSFVSTQTVMANDGSVMSDASSEVDNLHQLPLTFDLLSPADNSTVYPSSPTLSWEVNPPFVEPTRDNVCLEFDGSDDFVKVPHSGSMTSGNLTVAAWINVKRLPGSGERYSIVSKGGLDAGDGYELFIGSSGARWPNRITWALGDGTRACSGEIPSTDEWIHVVGTYDGKDLRLYINSVFNAIRGEGSASIVPNTDPLYMGRGYRGYLGEIRIYSRALSESEVDNLYDGEPVDSGGLVGRWGFDEGSGQTVSDSSGNGNDGTLGSSNSSESSDPIWVAEDLDHYEVWLDGRNVDNVFRSEYKTSSLSWGSTHTWHVTAVNSAGDKRQSESAFNFTVWDDNDYTPEQKERLDELWGSKIITIQPYDKIDPLDRAAWGEVSADYNENDLVYPSRLYEALGIEMQVMRVDEFNKLRANVEDNKAEALATEWINEAIKANENYPPYRGEAIWDPIRFKDLVKGAKAYYAYEELLEKYDADAITLATWTLMGYSSFPAEEDITGALPEMEFGKHGQPFVCESLIDVLITQMVMDCFVKDNRVGYAGDDLSTMLFSPKPGQSYPRNAYIHAHCCAPINPLGEIFPHVFREHILNEYQSSSWMKPEHYPVSTTARWPVGETVTLHKFDISRKRVSAFTGTTIDPRPIYTNWENEICRNKVLIRLHQPTDTYLTGRFKQGDSRDQGWGFHHVLLYGDWTDEVTDFAQLAGFRLITSTPVPFDLISPENNATTRDSTPILEWETSSDNGTGLDHYEVWIDGRNVDNVSAGITSYTTSEFSDGPHEWYVVAADNAGNECRSDDVFTFEIVKPEKHGGGGVLPIIAGIIVAIAVIGGILAYRKRGR